MESISKIADWLPSILKNVEEEIYFYGFDFTNNEFSSMIESSANWKSVRLVNCFVINQYTDYEFNDKIKYRIEELDLTNTYHDSDIQKFDTGLFNCLFESLSKTSFKTSLKKLYFNRSGDRAENNARETLEQYGYQVEVLLDSIQAGSQT